MTPPLLAEAMAAHQAGALDDAENLYRAFLQTAPDQPDALALLGCVLSAKGQTSEALSLIHQALAADPHAGLFHFYLGNALMADARYAESIEAFSRAANLAPMMADAPYNMGNALHLLGRKDQAAAAYVEALRRDERHIMARNNLALLLDEMGRPGDAVTHLKIVTALAPGFTDGWINLCNVAEKAGDFSLAYQAGLKASDLAPTQSRCWLGLGVALNRLGRHKEAAQAYETALRLEPSRADLWDNLGQTYQFQNDLVSAEKAYRQTIACENQTIDDRTVLTCDEKELGRRHWHLALLELLKGDLRHGFARYRARFGDVEGLKRPALSAKLWRGQELKGQTILIQSEQGMGDALMMARYLPLLRAQGAQVLFQIQPALVPYFEGWSGVDLVLTNQDPVPTIDFFASIFDLPYACQTTLETIPSAPYLPLPAPNPDLLLPTISGTKRVGFAWAGAPLHQHDRARTIPLQDFQALFDATSIQFYALCKDKRPGDQEILDARDNVCDLAPRLKDFRDTASFVTQMDLIITCDTSLAHLAGGMGKQVWLLLPFAPDWRWLLTRADSPWYPSLKIFRLSEGETWPLLIKQVFDLLRNEASLLSSPFSYSL